MKALASLTPSTPASMCLEGGEGLRVDGVCLRPQLLGSDPKHGPGQAAMQGLPQAAGSRSRRKCCPAQLAASPLSQGLVAGGLPGKGP